MTSTASAAPTTPPQPLTPLEQEVLDEYARLLENLNRVRPLPSSPPSPIPSRFARPIPHPSPAILPAPQPPQVSPPPNPTYHSIPATSPHITISKSWDQAQLSLQLSELSTRPTAEVLDGLRMLERKTSLVFTLLKASVYSIVLQQQVYCEEEEGAGG